MKLYISLLAIALLLFAGVAVAESHEKDEYMIKRSEVPQPVLANFEMHYPDHEVKEYSREMIDGEECYVIEIMEVGTEREYVYKPDGTLKYIEADMAVKSLPEKVTNAIMAKHKGADIKEADRIMHGKMVHYEVKIKNQDGQMHKLMVASNGEIQSSEMMTMHKDMHKDMHKGKTDDDKSGY